MLLGMRRQQDEDLDYLGESVTRIGHVGLQIHEELQQQVRHCQVPHVHAGICRIVAYSTAASSRRLCLRHFTGMCPAGSCQWKLMGLHGNSR